MTSQLDLWPDETPGQPVRWSVSRDRRLGDCLRKYFLFHYAEKSKGHSFDPRQVLVLKNLRNRFMWVGETVHGIIEQVLTRWKRNEEAPMEAMIERGTRQMRAQYLESAQGVYRQKPMSACGLWEHAYQDAVGREEWQRLRDLMERCVRGFYSASIAHEIKDMPRWRWVALESTALLDLDGAKVIVKPDFAWRNTDESIVLVDWKTGKPYHEARLQLAVYALYAKHAWGGAPGKMQGRLVYLGEDSEDVFTIDEAMLNHAREYVLTSVQQMRLLASSAAPKANLAAFPLTDDVKTCTYCNFKTLCGR